MFLNGLERFLQGFKKRVAGDSFLGMPEEVREPPFCCLTGFCVAHPAQLFLDPPSLRGQEVTGFQFREREVLFFGQFAAVMRLEHRPARGVGHLHLFSFSLAHLVDGSGEQLHHMEPVHRLRGVGEGLADSGEECGRHVTHHFGDTVRLAAMVFQERLEGFHRLFALTRRGEHHGGPLAVQIDEHCDVIVPLFRRRFVQGQGRETRQVQPRERLRDIMFDDPPQPLVGHLDNPGGGQNRHLARQHQGGLLEQKREPAAVARPRDGHAPDPVLRTISARNLGRDQTVVLKEVQMAPGEFLEIMRLACRTAVRTGKQCPATSLQKDPQNIRTTIRFQPLIYQPPRRRHTKPKR